MDRIINVSVGGNYLKKDNKNAGVRGEANVTMLRIAFDEGWDNFAKTVTFLDARGLNPVNVMLGVNLLEDRRVYLVPIPAEPMAVAGWLTFIVEGALNNKVQRSFADKLEVKDAPDTDDAVNAVDPVPSEVEQFQTEIEYIKENVQGAIEANKAIQNMSVSAETLKAGEQAFVEKTEKDGVVNLHYGLPAGGKGDKGEKGDSGKSAYEIALLNGFEGTEEEWVDWLRNGVDGKDGNPGVYVGTGEMPEGYSVQIDPSGEAGFSEEDLNNIVNKVLVKAGFRARIGYVTLLADKWVGENSPYSQVVAVDGVTENSQVDLTPSVEQLSIFHNKDLAFVTENEDGVVTVYAIGQKPENDYNIQVTITEVII